MCENVIWCKSVCDLTGLVGVSWLVWLVYPTGVTYAQCGVLIYRRVQVAYTGVLTGLVL